MVCDQEPSQDEEQVDADPTVEKQHGQIPGHDGKEVVVLLVMRSNSMSTKDQQYCDHPQTIQFGDRPGVREKAK